MRFDMVHLVGVGGTGSQLVEPLARTLYYHSNGTRNVHIWDGDVYEHKNGVRQLFDPRYLGKNKAVGTEMRLRHIVPSIIPHPEFITKEKLKDCIHNSPASVSSILIITAVDNNPTRGNLIVAAEELGAEGYDIGLVIPGNGERTGNVDTFTNFKGKFYAKHPFKVCKDWETAAVMAMPGSCGYEEVSSPQLVTTNAMASTLSLDAVFKLLEGEEIAYSMNFDLRRNTMEPRGIQPARICP